MPAYRLRDLLAECVAAVPPGGSIDWVTYYFRDRRLAEELLRAHRRGVKVTVTLERHPRTAHANEAVIAMLSGPNGLSAGFRTLSLRRVHGYALLHRTSKGRPLSNPSYGWPAMGLTWKFWLSQP